MRYYSSTAVSTTVVSAIGATAASVVVTSTSGFPSQFPYTLILDAGQANEEIVSVTAATGTTLSITRGQDGTFGSSHDAGAVVRHGISARDLREPQEHIDSTSGVHGVQGQLVGSTQQQTLTGKTLNGDDNTFMNIPASAIKGEINQAANASTSPTANYLVKWDTNAKFTVNTPTGDFEPTTKAYVDSAIKKATGTTTGGTNPNSTSWERYTTLGSGWSGFVQFWRHNDVCYMAFQIQRTTVTAAVIDVLTIPTKWLPKAGFFPVATANPQARIFGFNSEGQISVYLTDRSGSITPTLTADAKYSTGTAGNITWPLDPIATTTT